ncbi:MAG: VCBS repeat-containing protein [Pseudomonadota bacterium]
MKRIDLSHILIAIAVLLIFLWMPDFHVIAADRNRTKVLLFQVNSEKDMKYLQKGLSDILESRLAGIENVEIVGPEAGTVVHIPGEHGYHPEEIRKVYKDSNVDYIVCGSLTIVGNHTSLDARVIELSGTKGFWSFYRNMDHLDEVIPAAEQIAKEIEDTVFKGLSRNKKTFISTEKEDLKSRKEKRNDYHLQSIELPIQVIGLGAGDVDGDGSIEIVAASNHDIHIFHVKENSLVGSGEVKGEKYHSYLSINVADINKNGRAEIYISGEHTGSGSLTSFVMEWNGKQFSPIIQDQNWYFRVIRTEKGNQLLGQKKGISMAYMSGIYRLLWDGKVLMSAKQQEAFPDDTMVFGVSKGFAGQNANLTAAFDSSDRLSIINENGSIAWKSDVPYGGSERFVKTVEDYRDSEGERFYLPQRIVALDFEKKPMVIIPSNDSSSGRFFQKFRNYTNARFLFFNWDGMGLLLSRKSPDLSGYVSDFCIADVNNDGWEELIYALVTDRETAFRSAKSYLASEALSGLIIPHP